MKPLNSIKMGCWVKVVSLSGGRNAEKKLTEMGLYPGEVIKLLNYSADGPTTILVKGTKLAIGHRMADMIFVDEDIHRKTVQKRLTVALAGNPNSGKSTIFNYLTGSRQHVGNYPGVTVEKKEGKATFKNYVINFVDLPGTYSLSAYSEDEVVARDFVLNERPDVIVHIVDSSNLERNLYLFTQLLELEMPIVLAMNMSDIVDKKGHKIDYELLSALLGVPIVKTVGSKNVGLDKMLDVIADVYEGKVDCKNIRIDYGEEIEQELGKIVEMLSALEKPMKGYSPRWLAVKLLESDPAIISLIEKHSQGKEILAQAIEGRRHLKQHFSDDAEVFIAERRYGFISGACTQSVVSNVEIRHDISDKIDKVILNRFLGIPIFAIVMYAIFEFTFTFSAPVVDWFGNVFDKISESLTAVLPEGLFQSFIVDGIIGGVGGVLGFFPLVLFMFFAIAFFEDSGYMARAAFVMDKLMSKFGLHGKSFLPLMISTNGCAVPGILATRTLESKKDRLITMMVTPFMICGAKLPIFALFIGAFFPSDQGPNIMFLMYAFSIALAFTSAWILKKFIFKGDSAHFVMELPPYRIPTLQGLLLKMWERGWLYLQKAGTTILLISVIMWAGFTFPEHKGPQDASNAVIASQQLEYSYIGRFGKTIEPLVKPLGFDWRGGVALISGVAAKEVVVSTLGTMYSLGAEDVENAEPLKLSLQNDPVWTPLSAMAFLMFCLIYMPCVVAMSVFFKESGSSWKWTGFLIFWTTVMAWIFSFIVYQGGLLLNLGG